MIKLVRTCWACPEQYDAFDDSGNQVGYLRLRHGTFRVECPDCGGQVVYKTHTKGDGIFEDDERDYFLKFAVSFIEKWMRGEIMETVTEPPNVNYVVDDPWEEDENAGC